MAVTSGGSRSSSGSNRKPRARPEKGTTQLASQPRLWARLAPFIVAVACAAIYANSLNGPFLFDDRLAIQDNTSIQDLSALGAVLRPPEQTPVHGRPLANLTFAINLAI